MAWQGKIAIVTGGGSGIGRAICQQLGQHGAVVQVTDVDQEAAEEVADQINQSGGRASATYLDVTDQSAVQSHVRQTSREFGRLDYMFNNAGIAVISEVRDMSADHWRQILDVNLHGVIHGTTAAYRQMTDQGSGHIVNMASLAGLTPMPMGTAYSTTKHAVVGLSTSLRAEAVDHGVKVSVVCPGFIDTAIKNSAVYVGVDRQRLMQDSPLRFSSAESCARTLLKGVAKNKAIIIVTPFAAVAWRLCRLSPSIMQWFGRSAVRRMRQKAAEPAPDINSCD